MLLVVRAYLILFSLLSTAGGALGFVKAKSVPSLVAGSISGLLLVLAAVLLGGDHAHAAAILALVVCAVLEARFLPAFLRTRKAMPAGMMAALSIIGAVLTTLLLVQGI